MKKLFRKSLWAFTLILMLIAGSIIVPHADTVEWTDWLPENEAPTVYYDTSEARTEYRVRQKTTTTSYETSLSGYTRDGYQLTDSKTNSISYVSSFPSGFYKSHSLYNKYNNTAVKDSESDKQKTVVNSTQTVGYIYWHWCMNSYAYGPENRGINGSKSSQYSGFHAFETTSAIGYTSWAKCYKSSKADVCKDTYWWYGSVVDGEGQMPVYKQTYTTYNKLYSYYKWSDWSEWSTTEVDSSDSVQVQTRTTRRYKLTSDEVQKSKQKITIKSDSYNKIYGAKAFTLKAKTSGDGKLSYATSNKKVATVSLKGKVTIKGCGKAKITITAVETAKYNSATKKVVITVKPKKIKVTGYTKGSKITFKKQANVDGYLAKVTKIGSNYKKNIKAGKNSKYMSVKSLPKGKYRIKISAWKKISGKKVYGKEQSVLIVKG